VDNLCRRTEQGDVVLLTSLGYSSSGEIFNVPSEALAAECAAKIGASKVIYFTEGQVVVDISDSGGSNYGEGRCNGNGYKYVQSMRLPQAKALLQRYGVRTDSVDQVEVDEVGESPTQIEGMVCLNGNRKAPAEPTS